MNRSGFDLRQLYTSPVRPFCATATSSTQGYKRKALALEYKRRRRICCTRLLELGSSSPLTGEQRQPRVQACGSVHGGMHGVASVGAGMQGWQAERGPRPASSCSRGPAFSCGRRSTPPPRLQHQCLHSFTM